MVSFCPTAITLILPLWSQRTLLSMCCVFIQDQICLQLYIVGPDKSLLYNAQVPLNLPYFTDHLSDRMKLMFDEVFLDLESPHRMRNHQRRELLLGRWRATTTQPPAASGWPLWPESFKTDWHNFSIQETLYLDGGHDLDSLHKGYDSATLCIIFAQCIFPFHWLGIKCFNLTVFSKDPAVLRKCIMFFDKGFMPLHCLNRWYENPILFYTSRRVKSWSIQHRDCEHVIEFCW